MPFLKTSMACLHELELKGNFLMRNYNYVTNNHHTSLTQLQAVSSVSIESLLPTSLYRINKIQAH